MTEAEAVERIRDVIAGVLCTARSNGVPEHLCDRAIVEAQQVMWEAGLMDRQSLH